MKGNSILRKLAALLVVGVMAVMAIGPTPAAGAGNPNPGVIPPQAHPYGYTYNEWSAKYWQWIFSIRAPVNPLIDETGANCAEGQSGPVWFLASNFGGTTTRTCTIPPGKAILFQLMFSECSTIEPPESGSHGDTEAEMRACARGWMDQATQSDVSVDGVPITGMLTDYRFESPLFTFTLPDDNLLQWAYGDSIDAPGGATSQSVSDATIVMLAPLPAGQHTIHMLGSWPWGVTVDVTYNLTIGR